MMVIMLVMIDVVLVVVNVLVGMFAGITSSSAFFSAFKIDETNGDSLFDFGNCVCVMYVVEIEFLLVVYW